MSAIIIIDNKPTEVSDDACREIMRLRSENAALRSDLNKCNNLSEIRRDAFYDEKSARWAMVDRVRELERENAALRAAAVEVCILARVWVTVWGDKLSTESIQRFVELEKQILKEAQP